MGLDKRTFKNIDRIESTTEKTDQKVEIVTGLDFHKFVPVLESCYLDSPEQSLPAILERKTLRAAQDPTAFSAS